MKGIGKIAVASVLLITAAATAVFTHNIVPQKSAETTLFASPRVLPDLELMRADNNTSFGKNQLHDKWTLLYTGFLNCPDLCPTTLALMQQLQRQVTESDRGSVQFAFASIDYHRDDAAAVAAYTAQFNPEIRPLVGTAKQLAQLTEALGFIAPPDTAPYSSTAPIAHSSAIAIIGPDAKLRGLFRHPQNIQKMETTLQQLLSST